jgi:hypothetical protein
MFHATIHSDADEPLHVSGEVAPYDLEVLREHVLARGGRAMRVEVRLPAAQHPALLRALESLSRRGVELILESAPVAVSADLGTLGE